jgi:hypothetical protein
MRTGWLWTYWISAGVFILAFVTCCEQAIVSSCAHAETVAGLSCPRGLIVHRYAPESTEAEILRTRQGVELRVSQALVTITNSMVDAALISKLYQFNSPEERARRTPSDMVFWVALRLNRAGSDEVEKILTGTRNADLVAVCNGIVLIAAAVGKQRAEEINIMIDEHSTEAAEQFARSFTPNVRFEPRTPTSEQ